MIRNQTIIHILVFRLEMKQREGHFVHLAEETAVLKDQVDALRELSVMTLKNDNSIVDNGYSHDRRMSDKEAKAHAATGIMNFHHTKLEPMDFDI